MRELPSEIFRPYSKSPSGDPINTTERVGEIRNCLEGFEQRFGGQGHRIARMHNLALFTYLEIARLVS
jgi:hypothetical protein